MQRIIRGMISANSMTINGVKYENISGRNVSVVVDGVTISEGHTGDVKIIWEGDLASLDCTSAKISGSVHGCVDGTTIEIEGSVDGDIDGTSITVGGNVEGDIDGTSIEVDGDVTGDIDGNSITIKGRHHGRKS